MAAQLKMVDGQVVIVPGFDEDQTGAMGGIRSMGPDMGDRRGMDPDTREQIMSETGGVAGLLGGLRAASKSEGIYDAGKGGNWFEEMFLKRTGGGGKDYMIPTEAKERDLTEIMTIGPRDDLKAKKIEAERMGFFKTFLGKLDNLLDESYGDEEKMKKFREIQLLQVELTRDLRNGTNETGLNPKEYKDATPNETAANVIMKRFNLNQGGRVGFETGGMDEGKLKQLAYTLQKIEEPGGRFTDKDIAMQMERLKSVNMSGMDEKGLRQLAIQLARQMNPEGRLSEEDVERAMTIIKNQMEGNVPPESMMIDTTTSAYGDAGKERPVPVFKAKGGRVGYQTGGITETRTLPPEYVEALGKTYAADLTRQAGIPSITTATTQQPGETAEQFAQRQAQAQQFQITKAGMADLAPTVAPESQLQIDARTQAVDPTTGLGAYQPFLTAAQTAATGATALTGPMTTAQTTAYMSPYQQQVIDATLTEFDRQKQIQQNQIAAQTLGVPGAFGGGREGVQRAEYDAASDRNRAAIQSNLLQQGFQQAQAARQQDIANQLGISQLQSGLGARAQDFSRAQISGLGTLGAQQQAQSQAVLDAQRQAAQMAVEDPRRRLSMLGQGVAGLSGLGSVQIAPAEVAPQASPLTTALGLGLAGADIYGRLFPRPRTE